MRLAQLAVLVALAAAVAVLAIGRPGTAHSSTAPTGRTITVTGTGTASTVPDVASFSFGVQTDGATAREAQAANADRMSRVIAALRRLGIAKADLQTTDVSVGQKWGENGSVVGYTANNALQVRVRRVARAGHVADVAVAAGATQTYGPTFSHAARYKAALQRAVAQARSKAQALAAEANVQLGAAIRIDEVPEPPREIGVYGAALERTPAPTPVEPGTQETQATVTVTFALD